MCLYNTLIKNPKYTSNIKNGGTIPAVTDPRLLYVPIGCGKCIECRKQKSNNWKSRLMEDIKTYKNAHFITLTFSNKSFEKFYEENKQIEGYALDNWIATRAVRLFLERWRKKYKKSLRHWLITELGHNGTENIHLHGIVWTDQFLMHKGKQLYYKDEIKNIWEYGYVWHGTYVNEATINYMVKYVTKIDPQHKYYNPIILTSPGIGNNYTKTHNAKLNKFKGDQTKEHYTTRKGTKSSLPTYWRNKIYTDEEREKLWLNKLDQEERWVLGQKIDVSQNMNEYLTAVKFARQQNIKMGYGGRDNDYQQELYEQQLRQLKHLQRITNNNNNKIIDSKIELPPEIQDGEIKLYIE